MKLHLAVDVDGVLRNFVDGLYEMIIAEDPTITDRIRPPHTLDSFHIQNIAEDEDTRQAIMDFAFNEPETSYRLFRWSRPLYRELDRYKKLYRSLKENEDTDWTISICSSQHTPHQRQATADWLAAHEVPHDNSIMTSTGKGGFGFDVVIDDHIDNCLDVLQSGGYSILKQLPHSETREHELDQYGKFCTKIRSLSSAGPVLQNIVRHKVSQDQQNRQYQHA